MIKEINTKDFLKYIKKNYPDFVNIFFKNKSFLKKVINTFYTQEFLYNSLNTNKNNKNLLSFDNWGTHKDNYLLIPINIDNM